MSKQFRNCNLNQACLLPSSLQGWLPEGHLARFVADMVEALDRWAIYAQYEEGDGRGLAAYDLRMTVRLLIHGYCRGVASSRRIERATYDYVIFRFEQHVGNGRVDYLPKDAIGRILCVLEAKREELDPYDAEEQARGYPRAEGE